MTLITTIIGAILFILGVAWINLVRTPSGSQVGVVIGTVGAVLTIGALLAHWVS
jgi:hypothetical protein